MSLVDIVPIVWIDHIIPYLQEYRDCVRVYGTCSLLSRYYNVGKPTNTAKTLVLTTAYGVDRCRRLMSDALIDRLTFRCAASPRIPEHAVVALLRHGGQGNDVSLNNDAVAWFVSHCQNVLRPFYVGLSNWSALLRHGVICGLRLREIDLDAFSLRRDVGADSRLHHTRDVYACLQTACMPSVFDCTPFARNVVHMMLTGALPVVEKVVMPVCMCEDDCARTVVRDLMRCIQVGSCPRLMDWGMVAVRSRHKTASHESWLRWVLRSISLAGTRAAMRSFPQVFYHEGVTEWYALARLRDLIPRLSCVPRDLAIDVAVMISSFADGGLVTETLVDILRSATCFTRLYLRLGVCEGLDSVFQCLARGPVIETLELDLVQCHHGAFLPFASVLTSLHHRIPRVHIKTDPPSFLVLQS